MITIGELVAKLKLDTDGFEQSAEGANKTFKASALSIKTAAIAAGGAAVAALGAIGVAAFKTGLEFDDAFDAIRAKTGATGEALDALSKDFTETFKAGPQAAADVADAIADLNQRLGLTGEPLQALARQMLNLAELTGEEVGPLIAATTRLFGDWSISTEQQSATLDKLFRASQATGVGVDELAQNLVKFGAPMRLFGISFDEAAALMSKWEKEGVNTELVMGSLRIAVGKFTEEGVPLREGLLQTIKRIEELGPTTEAVSVAMEVFGRRAGADMAAAITEGRFAIDDIMKAIGNSGETINKATADTQGFAERWDILKNNVAAALAPLGIAMLNALDALMPTIIAATGALAGLINAILKAIDVSVKFAADVSMYVTKMVDTVYNQLVARFTAIVDGVKQKIEAITGFFKGMYDKVAGNSYVPDMMAVVEHELGPHFEDIAGNAQQQADAISASFATMGDDVAAVASSTTDALEQSFGARVAEIAKEFGFSMGSMRDIFGDVQRTILGWAGELVDGLRESLVVRFKSTVEDFVALWKSIEKLVKGLVDSINKVLNFGAGPSIGPGIPGSGGNPGVGTTVGWPSAGATDMSGVHERLDRSNVTLVAIAGWTNTSANALTTLQDAFMGYAGASLAALHDIRSQLIAAMQQLPAEAAMRGMPAIAGGGGSGNGGGLAISLNVDMGRSIFTGGEGKLAAARELSKLLIDEIDYTLGEREASISRGLGFASRR